MRYARVPSDIVFVNKQSLALRMAVARRDGIDKAPEVVRESWSLQRYAMVLWLDDERWTTPKARIAWLVKVVEELEKPPGEVMVFADEAWELLRDIIATPAVVQGRPLNLNPLAMAQLAPTFEGAILEASTTDPRASSTAAAPS
jgi:hypothetical protein